MSTQTISMENQSAGPKVRNAALWVLQIGVAAMFAMAGSSKLLGNPQMVGMFQAIGLGQWFRYLTGALEISGAILLLVPALSGVGGLLLTGVMGGALATHLFVIGGDPTMAIVLLVASVVIAVARRDRTLKLLGR
jgi:putative oxidoreductase